MPPSAHIAAVIPAFEVGDRVADVVGGIPPSVSTIVAVDDCSADNTGAVLDHLCHRDERLVVIHHKQNRGVGGATKAGYCAALERGADVIVKIDGDGQMAPIHLLAMVTPLLSGRADYAKGNRFSRWSDSHSMPWVRRVGNIGLSLLTRIAIGYAEIRDPTNGYMAVTAATLRRIDFGRLEERYLFESSVLVELRQLNARIEQVPIAAVYDGAPSGLSVFRALREFPPYLLRARLSRGASREMTGSPSAC